METWRCNRLAGNFGLGSYRTYEEWKHFEFVVIRIFISPVLTVPMRNGNFVCFPFLNIRFIGSYRTYEEWKHILSSGSLIAFTVLTVPMRNGNMKQISSFRLVSGFLPYLWGMETFAFVFVLVEPSAFLPYLWGMETCDSIIVQDFKVWFLPYLWGMETTTCQDWKDKRTKFLPYLWGMETWRHRSMQRSRISSYRTYEEWKLCCRYSIVWYW